MEIKNNAGRIRNENAIEVYKACRRLSISRTTLYRWLRDPDMGIVFGKRGGRIYIDATTLPEIKKAS